MLKQSGPGGASPGAIPVNKPPGRAAYQEFTRVRLIAYLIFHTTMHCGIWRYPTNTAHPAQWEAGLLQAFSRGAAERSVPEWLCVNADLPTFLLVGWRSIGGAVSVVAEGRAHSKHWQTTKTNKNVQNNAV